MAVQRRLRKRKCECCGLETEAKRQYWLAGMEIISLFVHIFHRVDGKKKHSYSKGTTVCVGCLQNRPEQFAHLLGERARIGFNSAKGTEKA